MERRNHKNFLTKDEITKIKSQAEAVTLFIKRSGKKKLWQPDKFAATRRAKLTVVLKN